MKALAFKTFCVIQYALFSEKGMKLQTVGGELSAKTGKGAGDDPGDQQYRQIQDKLGCGGDSHGG